MALDEQMWRDLPIRRTYEAPEPYRELITYERTETLLHVHEDHVRQICGCEYWREEDIIRVTWCERHTPSYLYDQAGVEYA